MKKLFSIVLLMACSITLMAQSSNNEDEVVKIDKWNQQAYREGEILVKFKADGAVQMRAPRRAKFATSQVNAIDALFAELGVDSIEQLMPQTGHKNVGRRVRAYNGSDVEVKDLSKLYRLTLNAEKAQTIHEAIDRLKELDEVEFAEPNYVVYTMALPYQDEDIPTADQQTYMAEPLYSQQWGLAAINLPALWDKPKKSSKRPVIAILDTGVDIEHPDLKDNIWTNEAEKNGVTGKDDDGNGIIDDIHGYDFVNQTGGMADFNGHGTHCAGIAAAVGNNGIGITGANPDALIMPVTVMQSNGTGDVATIIRGIDYAAANGADVISMSIGSYAYSQAEEQALGRAYSTAVLVAAAGNDKMPLEGRYTALPNPWNAYLCFPAAYSFVLGVEATLQFLSMGSFLAPFSNFDPTGPVYSSYQELFNYELRAPGVGILSTFPGGRYKKLNGTSMACPLVAGAISRLLQCKEILSKEILFGDLIHTKNEKNENIDIFAAYNITDADRHPELTIVHVDITDTISGDRDNQVDAGETIELLPSFKNAWGQAENIRFWVKTGSYLADSWVWDDTTLVTHLQDTAYFGKPLSSYAKATSKNPYRISISPDCPDGRKINLTIFAICDNATDTLKQQIALDITNGVELGGLLTEDLTLYPNVHYIITSVLGIPEGVTLTVKPGTHLQINVYNPIQKVGNGGNLVMNGTKDSLIVLTGTMHFNWANTFRYIRMDYFGQSSWNTPADKKTAPIFENCIFPGYGPSGTDSRVGQFIQCNFYTSLHVSAKMTAEPQYCNFSHVIGNDHYGRARYGWGTGIGNVYPFPLEGLTYRSNDITTYHVDSTRFMGACEEKTLRKISQDYTTGYGWGTIDFSTMCKRPSSLAHGTVWKVLIDNINAFDDFELLPPIGVGKHKCEVYFNRAMDTLITPFVSYGVREPYTQHVINENGSWSADSTIYTAYFTIDAKTASDGLNQIYVADAQDDEHFEIFIENVRFKMELAAAGSLSTGLMAEAGLGKVTLTWETDEEDFADLLGYNIYRWTQDTIKSGNTWRFDTICINSSLIDSQDTAYIDYNVIPGKAYYYVIRQMTTSMNSYDLSNPVTATPLTSIKGDANGSMSVDVADVITEVAYLTGGNPQPFIFEAADVNADQIVNILDIVGTVNIITNPAASSLGFSEDNTATYCIEDGILYVETPVVLGGVQFTFDAEAEISALEALNGFEQITWNTTENLNFMAYSMSGKTLGVGKHALLYVGNAEMKKIILSNADGQNIPAIQRTTTDLSSVEAMQMRLPNPNPFTTQVNIPYVVGQTGAHNIRFVFTNIAGLIVDSYTTTNTFGEYTYTWRPANALPQGVYFVTLYVDGKKIQSSKLVKVK